MRSIFLSSLKDAVFCHRLPAPNGECSLPEIQKSIFLNGPLSCVVFISHKTKLYSLKRIALRNCKQGTHKGILCALSRHTEMTFVTFDNLLELPVCSLQMQLRVFCNLYCIDVHRKSGEIEFATVAAGKIETVALPPRGLFRFRFLTPVIPISTTTL